MKDQLDKMRRLFQLRPCQKIPLYEIMRIAAQYNARILELRREGMNIINHRVNINGVINSFYEYMPDGELFGAAGFGKGG